ncbi:hypothetical protein LTR92_003975 [Exophiala xenobiotica]|nr:hypothetical protein LTR92_003975 [Exophiala xenobiotica]KAK5448957.1 hypothetical protein LTR18_002045 [Exophiala xenobiotica]
MEKTQHTRNRAPPKEEWDRIRPHLERYYIEERLPLEKVANKLETERNFRATTWMYKRRLDKWDLRKNFNMTQLAAAADVVEPFYRVGLNPPKLLVDNRELPVKLVRRHFADRLQKSNPLLESRKHRHTRKGLHLRTASSKTHVQKIVPEVPTVTLHFSPGMGLFEKTLIQVNYYYTWRSSKEDDYFLMQNPPTTQSCEITHPSELYNLFSSLNTATIGQAFHLVPNLFREVLNMAPRIISEQHPELLRTFLNLCSRRTTKSVDHMMSAIFSHLTSMARKLLSESHPILMVLQLRLQRLEMDIPFLSLLRLIHGIALRQHDHCWGPLFALELDMVSPILYSEGPAAASRFCEDSLRRYQEMLGPDHLRYRRLTLTLARMLHNDGRDLAAQGMCQELLDAQYSPQSVDFHEEEWTRLETMNLLGDIIRDRDDYEEAAYWYRQAYDGCKEYWGPDHEDALLALHTARRMERKVARFKQSARDGSKKDTEEPETTDEQGLEQLIRELGEDITRLDIDDAANTSAPAKEPWEPSSLAFEDLQASRCASEADFILGIAKTNGAAAEEQRVVQTDLTGFEASQWPSSSQDVVDTQYTDPQIAFHNDTSAIYADGTSYQPSSFEQGISVLQAPTLSENRPNTTFDSGSTLPSSLEQYMPITPMIAMADNAQQALNDAIDALPPLNTDVDLEMLGYTPVMQTQPDFDPRIHEVDMDFNMDDLINWDDGLDSQGLLQWQERDTSMLYGL